MAITRITSPAITSVASTAISGTLPAANINDTSIGNITALPAGVGGKVLQVVSANKTNSFTTTSTAFSDVTGLSVSITPSSSSNKILIIVTLYMSAEVSPLQAKLFRGESTELQFVQDYPVASNTYSTGSSVNMSILDTPSTTSATTYKVQIASSNNGNNAKVNGRWDSGSADIGDSTITVMEIAG